MYAIIQVGGNQYRVNPGSSIKVDRVNAKEGEALTFPALLVADDQEVKVGKEAARVIVTAAVVAHTKGDKVKTLRFRAKSRHRRRVGMRPQLSLIKITSIGEGESVSKVKTSRTIKKRVTRSKKSQPND